MSRYNKVYSCRYRADNKLPVWFSGKDMSSKQFSSVQRWHVRLEVITLMGKLRAKKSWRKWAGIII